MKYVSHKWITKWMMTTGDRCDNNGGCRYVWTMKCIWLFLFLVYPVICAATTRNRFVFFVTVFSVTAFFEKFASKPKGSISKWKKKCLWKKAIYTKQFFFSKGCLLFDFMLFFPLFLFLVCCQTHTFFYVDRMFRTDSDEMNSLCVVCEG